jgi:general secretion pathway protein A
LDAAALDRVYELSGGVPRVINLLCDRALMLGAEAGVSVITDDLIQKAAAGLAINSPVTSHWWRRALPWAILAVALLILASGLWFANRT